MEAGLVDMILNAVDGTKITARASTDKAWMRKNLEKRLAKLVKVLDLAMAEVEREESNREYGCLMN
jgi:hypothetical protein